MSFQHEDAGKTISNLNPNEAHDHDSISMRIFGSTIYRPLTFS